MPRDPHHGDVVKLRAEQIADRMRWSARGILTGRAIWPTPLILLGSLILDASIPLPSVARFALDVIIILMLARILFVFIRPERRRTSLLAAARRLEERAQLAFNPVVNALQLREAAMESVGWDEALVRRAVDDGVDAVEKTRETSVTDSRPLRRAWLAVLGSCVAIVLVAAASPRLFAMGLPRFIEPFADHPPFTRTNFDIGVTPDAPLWGDDVRIDVTLGGPLPEALDLVILDADGGVRQRVPMIADRMDASATPETAGPPTSYSLRLERLREPVAFHIAGSTGRSKSHRIAPIRKPRYVNAIMTVTPPEYVGRPPRAHRIPLTGPLSLDVIQGSRIVADIRTSLAIERIESDNQFERSIVGDRASISSSCDVIGSQTLRMRAIAVDGLPADETLEIAVTVLADAPPRLDVRQPDAVDQDAFLLIGRGLPIAAQAQDDVRVATLEARWSIRSPEGALRDSGLVDLRTGPGDRIVGGSSLLAASAARANDVLSVTFVARDNRAAAFGGPQETTVGPIEVTILDEEQFLRRFVSDLDIDDVVTPYEDIAKRTADLARRAEAMERAVQRSEDQSDAAAELAEERDALRREVQRRLDAPPALDFDEQMRPALERLAERLDSTETPPQDSSEADGIEEDRRRLEVASEEAALDVARPAEQLRLANELQRKLETLESIVDRQRRMAQRLEDAGDLDDLAQQELAAAQQRLLLDLESTSAELATLGRQASLELPAPTQENTPAAIASDVRSRTQDVQDALSDARALGRAIESRGNADLVTQELMDILDSAVDDAITTLHFASDPLADGLESAEAPPRSLDEPGAAEAARDRREAAERAIEAIDRLERMLEEAESTMRPGEGPLAHGIVPSAPTPVLVATLLLGQSAGTSDAAEMAEAIAAARLRLDALRAAVRRSADRYSPPLPEMGASAIDLSDRVEASGAPDHMAEATAALESGDATAAVEHARAAADALEALYEESQSGSGESQSESSDLDRPLQLTNPSESDDAQDGSKQNGTSSPGSQSSTGQSSESSSDAESSESQGDRGTAGPPDALSQLSQNRRDGSNDGAGDEAGPQSGSSQQSLGDGQERGEAGGEGETGGRSGDAPPLAGQSLRPGEGEGRAGQSQDSESSSDARFFNESLDEEGDAGDASQTAGLSDREVDATNVEEIERLRRAASASAARVFGADDGLDVEASFHHVPPAYRDIVAAYFLRIAREQSERENQP
ncbi:MAG: hypothetical protein RIB32_02625 [Phycisphaerales bacterium]